MLIWNLCLQHPSTTASSKLPRPRRSIHSLRYSVTLDTCYPSLVSYLSTSHFQARLPSLSQPTRYLSCLSIITSSHVIRSNTIASINIRPPSCWTSSQNYTCLSGLPICCPTNLKLSACARYQFTTLYITCSHGQCSVSFTLAMTFHVHAYLCKYVSVHIVHTVSHDSSLTHSFIQLP